MTDSYIAFTRAIGILTLSSTFLLSACTPPNTIPSSTSPQAVSFDAPETVELPAGEFYMGDLNSIGDSDERPVQQQQVSAFAMGKYEVTVEQFDAFTDATGRSRINDNGWGRNTMPASNISWQDAMAYTYWLTMKTGQSWRLPSEVEWEYAARAGSLANYHSGNQANSICRVANIADQSALQAGMAQQVTQCNDGAVNLKQVGSYQANAYGLYDVHGNVWEWVASCYQTYGSGSSRQSCDKKVIRGGSFKTPASSARLSNREALTVNDTSAQVGFRVVRDL